MKHSERAELKKEAENRCMDILGQLKKSAFELRAIPRDVVDGSLAGVFKYKKDIEQIGSGKHFMMKWSHSKTKSLNGILKFEARLKRLAKMVYLNLV